MRKHIKREDPAPRAGKTVPLVISKVETHQQPAANAPAKHGKLDYQGKRKPAPPASAKPVRVERRVYAQGRYIGDGKKLTAFVWLDDVLPGDAANEA